MRHGWGAAALLLALIAAPAQAQDIQVDLELVLAIDVSQSVDAREGRLQRDGYVRAFRDPRIAEVIRNGQYGRIAVTYMEWAGAGLWQTTVPWQVIGSPAEALAFANVLEETPVARGSGTSISSAIFFGSTMFGGNRIASARRVIDISGDGPNSSGPLVTLARDEAVAAGITINGVAINDREITNFSLPDLDVYYEECVIGGPGAFVLAADGFESFAEAILRKMILEIADVAPERPARIERAQFLGGPARAKPQKYGPACDIGERMRFQDQGGFPPGLPLPR